MNDKSFPVSREEFDSLEKDFEKIKELDDLRVKRFEEYKAAQARKEEKRKKEEEKLKKEHDNQIANLIKQNNKLNEDVKANKAKAENAEKVAYEALEKNAKLENEVGAFKSEVKNLKNIVKTVCFLLYDMASGRTKNIAKEAFRCIYKVSRYDNDLVEDIILCDHPIISEHEISQEEARH